jgi:large subunit ribosomal protein L22
MATSADTLRRTNERPGTRAVLSNLRTSAYKVRQVLDLIRGKDVRKAQEILQFSNRGPAEPVGKLLNSAIANAVTNDGLDADELFVSACFADEGPTMKRFRPRAKGRASRIRKRSSRVTIIVSRLPEERLTQLRSAQAEEGSSRNRRVAGSRAARVAASKQEEPSEQDTNKTSEEVVENEATPAAKSEAPTKTEASADSDEVSTSKDDDTDEETKEGK